MAESSVACASASRRYTIIPHRGHACRAGQARITGCQKRSAVRKKHACSTWCQRSDRSATSYSAGTCHAQNATTNETHATRGSVRTPVSRRTGPVASTEATARRARSGSPASSGATGAPSQSSGGATTISEQVLDHVRLEPPVAQRVDRRAERQEHDAESRRERRRAPGPEALGHARPERRPAAQVERGGRDHRHDHRRLEAPRERDGLRDQDVERGGRMTHARGPLGARRVGSITSEAWSRCRSSLRPLRRRAQRRP